MSEEKKEEKKTSKDCIHCGMCLKACPVYKILKDEVFGPRGRAMMLKEEKHNETFFDCTLCKACEKACPLGIKLGLTEARQNLKKTEKNEKMIENIRKYGDPFGEPEEDEDKTPDELYCC